MTFRAERAISPVDGSVRWVIADESYTIHTEGCAYLTGLRQADRSPNTERVYAGRVALYLSYCVQSGMVWNRPGFFELGRFAQWLITEPLPPKRDRSTAVRFRSKKTANAVLTTVSEFLRFGSVHGWVPQEVVAQLSEPKYLSFLPPGYEAGERDEFRTVQARIIKFTVGDEGIEWLQDAQIEQLLELLARARDRFLVALLRCTGMRIGEGLGLRREDMHFLARSTTANCQVVGPHVHVRRRLNPNGALAKSLFSRWIPVTEQVVDLYADYQHERARVPEAAETDMVFVNLFRAPLGRPMTYPNTKDMFDRLARRAGFPARPHMLRHSAATSWIRSGVQPDVAQHLLGHASPSSMQPYLHATDRDKREAVESTAARRREAR
ncbi:tyrosine-type recombinase/integrase [Streptomyces sp. NBC_00872]|uniref:tyrosine-type recombinase/integrase n=1 Tax=Streptomyces sp. NBC_00872 TaxID=2903686 RepID=UPI003864C91C|nr:tyrosine-type recombinase/integrase [Streptomyces sp. NBC_00872]